LKPKLVTLRLWICLLVLLLFITINRGTLLIDTYFFIRRPLEWSPEQIGYYGGYNSVTHGMALLLLMPIALTVGIPDVILAIVGVVCSGVGYLFIAGVKETWQMYASKSVYVSDYYFFFHFSFIISRHRVPDNTFGPFSHVKMCGENRTRYHNYVFEYLGVSLRPGKNPGVPPSVFVCTFKIL